MRSPTIWIWLMTVCKKWLLSRRPPQDLNWKKIHLKCSIKLYYEIGTVICPKMSRWKYRHFHRHRLSLTVLVFWRSVLVSVKMRSPDSDHQEKTPTILVSTRSWRFLMAKNTRISLKCGTGWPWVTTKKGKGAVFRASICKSPCLRSPNLLAVSRTIETWTRLWVTLCTDHWGANPRSSSIQSISAVIISPIW